MKDKFQVPSLDNISFLPLENESSLQKENSMQLHVKKLCRGGRWFHYLAVPLRQRSRFNGLSPGSRVMRRLSCSSTMTRQAVRRRRMQQASYHLARSRSLRYRTITKMRQTPSLPMTLKRFVELYGMRGSFVQTGSLTASPS